MEVCWDQWRALGFSAGDAPGPLSEVLIDPEALLVLTFGAVRDEPRLGDALDWWAAVGASLLSLPRLDAVLALAPSEVASASGPFAARVVAAGSASASWKRRADGFEAVSPVRIKGSREARLTTPGALILRLRAAFGVGAKADVLAFLIAQRGQPATTRATAASLGYAGLTVRRALSDLVIAGFAKDLSTTSAGPRPGLFALLPTAVAVGGPTAVPPWRPWVALSAFWLRAVRWGGDISPDDPERDYLLASSARRIYDLLPPDLHVVPIEQARVPPAAWIRVFSDEVRRLADWTLAGLPNRTGEAIEAWERSSTARRDN